MIFRFKFLLFILAAGLIASCRKDLTDTSSAAAISFSQQTVFFDTVFTTVGSTTQYLKVYNTNNQKIVISNVQLVHGNNSLFRLNVDGVPCKATTNVTI